VTSGALPPLSVLRRAELERLLTPRDVVDALDAALRAYAAGRTRVPLRTIVPAENDGLMLVMPAVMGGVTGSAGAAGTKIVTFYPHNRAADLPTHVALYLLLDATTGMPLALLEASFLTALRTGATSALAAHHLAREDAGDVACFGTSVQAGFQLRCLSAVRRLRRVAVVGRDAGRAAAFADAMTRELGLPVEVSTHRSERVRSADIVTCATTATEPIVFGADLGPGTHVDAVGAFRPDTRELDSEVLRRARVVVETYEGVLATAGDVVIPMKEGAITRESIAAELAEVVTGARPGRRSADEITVFKSVGWALEDLAAAELAYRAARRQGLGTEVSL
jgi:ornithine cyclodeaminase/alanine dehydrogenase-like protein (mu-crystallin family)